MYDDVEFTYEDWCECCEYGIRKLINNGGIRDCINTRDVAIYLSMK